MLSLGLTLIRRLIVGASNVRNVIEKTLDTPTIRVQIKVKLRAQVMYKALLAFSDGRIIIIHLPI